ncbi:MAG: hypothetical protein E7666_07825 [Ruminococcaceae bacterium]|nr:hypothetical protein [Oscillospiraceae bacterium]
MNIELKTLAERLGITEYPGVLEPIYASICKQAPICGIPDTLEQLHLEFAPFGDYYDFVLRGARALQNDKDLLIWLTLGVTYCKDATENEAAHFPLPLGDGSEARDVFPILLIALELPETVKRYRAHGFDDAQIRKNLGNLAESIRAHALSQGRATISRGSYNWLIHYTKARIFDHMGFVFQAGTWGDEAILLRNRKSGEQVFLMLKGRFTALGTLVGLRGAEDVPALFEATLEETETAFIGYRAVGQQVCAERECFAKNEWDAILRPGDDVIKFHIPRGADFTPSHVEESMKQGFMLCKRHYPECNFRKIVCTSWMLDPKLLDILPEHAKIAQFIRRFVLFPSGDTAGTACMSYVWPGETCSTGELPENTSLQRGIKRMMLENSYIFWTTGAWR